MRILLLSALFLCSAMALSAEEPAITPAAQKALDVYAKAEYDARVKYQATMKPARDKAIAELKKEIAKAMKAGDKPLTDALQAKVDELAVVVDLLGNTIDPKDVKPGKEMQVPIATGVSLGKLPVGTIVEVQYVGGTWTSQDAPRFLVSPDVDAGGMSCSACLIIKIGAELRRVVVPTGTAKVPFRYQIDTPSEEVILGSTSTPCTPWMKEPVTYRVTILPPVPAPGVVEPKK